MEKASGKKRRESQRGKETGSKDLRSQAAQKDAELGNADAQYNLGLCYLKGFGIRKNSRMAEKWLRRAAEQKQKDALKLLREL